MNVLKNGPLPAEVFCLFARFHFRVLGLVAVNLRPNCTVPIASGPENFTGQVSIPFSMPASVIVAETII
jgi:hypothetical protein